MLLILLCFVVFNSEMLNMDVRRSVPQLRLEDDHGHHVLIHDDVQSGNYKCNVKYIKSTVPWVIHNPTERIFP